ncbi:MAG: nickel/cobalt exporter [Myxococcota bacterium]
MIELTDGLSISVLAAAATIGFVHTLLGPDHYLPFVTLARAQHWSLGRTLTTVAACGTAHVLGSAVLGGAGLALGAAIGSMEGVDAGRGSFAAWAMVLFGACYGAWGVRQAWVAKAELTPHAHGDHVHIHRQGAHTHAHQHAHVDGQEPQAPPRTFWALLILFIVGPCEPLIPLFVLPASRGRWDIAIATIAVFGVVTVATMLAVTTVGFLGARKIQFGSAERYAHAMAGGAVAVSGLMVIGLGL